MKKGYILIGVVLFSALFITLSTVKAQSGENDQSSENIYLAFFGSKYCPKCESNWKAINRVSEDYPSLVTRKLSYWDNRNLEESLFEIYGVPGRDMWRAVFIGDNYLLGNDITESNLRELIEKNIDRASEPPWEMVETDGEDDVDRLKSWGVITIIAAGLIDGINPCAFAVIIFFISYLASIGGDRRKMILVGSSYIIAVFSAYLLVGFGIMYFLGGVSEYSLISRIIEVSASAFAGLLGLVSLYDYYLFRQGKTNEMKLQLPDSIKKRTHGVIRKAKSNRFLVPFVFLIGVIISLFELGCTGQVYLPTIVGVINQEALHARAITYLVLYNLMFVVPLIVIFALVALGTSSEELAEFSKENTGKVKILIALVLFSLAVFPFLPI